jgi:hypothetical protein
LLSGTDTPAGDGWTCTVTCTPTSGTALAVSAPQEGATADFRVTLTPAQTTTLGAGVVRWVALATDGTEAWPIGGGYFELATLSGQTAAEAKYTALRTAYDQLALSGVAAYQIGARTVTKHDLPALKAELNSLAREIQRERYGRGPRVLRGEFTRPA